MATAPQVAIVDDDEAKRYLLARRLRALGLFALELASAAEALEHAGAPVLAWLLDVKLPDRDGLSLCRELRARGVQGPIYLQSARMAEPQERARAQECGATAAFTDADTEALLAAVAAAVKTGS